MSSSKRVFSNDTTLNYNDYNSKKIGKSILENIYKSGPFSTTSNYVVNDNIISQVFDYNTFLLLTKSYFNLYECCNNNNFKHPITILDATKSAICYENLLSHIKDCDYCCNCKNIYDVHKCKQIQNILYPYGLYYNNEVNLQFPYRLDLNDISLCKKYPIDVDKLKCNPCKKPCNDNLCCKPKCRPCFPVTFPPFSNKEINPNYRFIENKNCCNKLKCDKDCCCCKKNKIIYPSQYNFEETTNLNTENISKKIAAFSNYPKNI